MKRIFSSTGWVYVVAVIALLPALFLRDFTPDNELRYLSIAKEALQNGSVFCFYNHGEIYADKPPLYLWIVMLGRKLFGINSMWFIGLFSLIPMLICGRVMDQWAAPQLSVRQRQCGLLMLFTCGYFPGLAITLRMDMLFTLWILLALREVYMMATLGYRRRHEALLGLYVFMALFTKGPLGVLIPLVGSLVWLVWIGKAREFRHIWGWPAWAVLVGGSVLWFLGVYCEGGADYLNNLLFHQTVDRSVNAFTHARPWWYYVVHMWYIMAPWSVLVAVLAVLRCHLLADGPLRRMALAVFLATLVMLSCISSKLQVYMLPVIPFVVYLGATLLMNSRLEKVVRAIALTILGLVFVGSWFIPRFNPTIGYGSVCREIREQNPRFVLVEGSVRRGENIDAYFDSCATLQVPDDVNLNRYILGTYIIKQDNGTLYYECNR